MTSLPKKPAKTTAPKLARLARSLPEPVDFYAGRRRTDAGLPDNILVFHRRTAAQLAGPGGRQAFHQRHVLIVPLAGSGRVLVDNAAVSLRPGRCLLLPPYRFHHYAGLGRERLDWLFVTFDRPGGPAADPVTARIVPPAFVAELGAFLEAYARTLPASAGDALAWRLALLLDRLAGAPPGRAGDATPLLAAIGRLASAATVPRSLTLLARELGLSPSHLRQRFRDETGISLGRFLRESRLQRAAELLASGQANVSQAADATGWGDAYAFSRAFRRYWGRSPKRFALARR